MPVAMTDIEAVAQRLAATHVEPTGVSFQGKSLKLNTEDDAKEVVDAIGACTDLTFLNLEGNTLGVEASKAIAKGLESHPELKRALWKDMFTGRMKTEIPKALEFLGQGLMIAQARLVELDLSDNAFGPIGVQGLAVLLHSPPCYTLQELRLNNNGLGISGGKMLAKALLDCHKNSQTEGKGLCLRTFIAGRNRLENEGATALAEVFKTVGTLEELAMPQNGIYHVGISALSEALQHNPNLRLLNLNDNTLTARGAAALAKAIPYLPGLHTLNLGDCLLKTKGALLLSEVLKPKHSELEEVYLSCNEIGVSGGLALVDALANKTKLRTLDIDGNQFGEEGCDQIRGALHSNGHIDALTGLEEDEGEDDEDENDDAEEEDDNEESDQSDSDEETNAGGDAANKDDKTTHQQGPTTVHDFLENPSGEKLLAVTTEKLLHHAKFLPAENYVEQLLPMLMKVSALASHKNDKVQDVALSTSAALLRHYFSWMTEGEPSRCSLANNALLVHLGLIKGEDKSLKVTWNLDGCLRAIEHSLGEDIIPSSTCHLLRFFLERPTSSGDIGNDLLSTKKRILSVLTVKTV